MSWTILSSEIGHEELKKFEEFSKIASQLKDFNSPDLKSSKEKGPNLLTQLRVMKFEGVVLEAFKQLRQVDSIKRVVRRNNIDIATGKVPKDLVLPQVLKECDRILAGDQEQK